jgi:NAD(P)-dependent dehydrogenase (short-subunit alcohol dehydrogenase family)
MSKLQGKVAVVTGGNSGIGFAIAKRFVEEGAFVYVTGRRPPELNKAVVAIGSNVVAVRGDVQNLADLDRLYARSAPNKAKSMSSLQILVSLIHSRSPEPRKQASTKFSPSMCGA